MEIVKVDINELICPEYNPRQITDDEMGKLKNSINEFGYVDPIIVNKHNNHIVGGNQRYCALKSLGYDEVDVIFINEPDINREKALNLALNKISGEWDFVKLADILDDLELNDFDISLTGFDELELEDFGIEDKTEHESTEIVEDDYEEPDELEVMVQTGDIYILGNHRLMCGDSTKREDVALLMDGKQADMVFTDPPWNVNYEAGTENMPYKTRSILNDSMTTEDFKNFMLSVFQNMNQFSKEGCMTYVVMSAQEWGNLMLTLNEAGYHWSSTIIWKKNNFVISRKDYHTQYEPIYYGWKDGAPRLHPVEDRKQSDVWDIERPRVSAEHPTMKPIELVARAITNSSNPSDIVLDLFGGSGTTIIASEQTDRQCMMMELDPKYCQVIINRWEEFTGEKAEKIEED